MGGVQATSRGQPLTVWQSSGGHRPLWISSLLRVHNAGDRVAVGIGVSRGDTSNDEESSQGRKAGPGQQRTTETGGVHAVWQRNHRQVHLQLQHSEQAGMSSV